MKRWLAVNRWRLLLSLGAIVALRVVIAALLAFTALDDVLPLAVRLIIVTACNVAICAVAIVTVVAFVQYGRIFNPRIPTE